MLKGKQAKYRVEMFVARFFKVLIGYLAFDGEASTVYLDVVQFCDTPFLIYEMFAFVNLFILFRFFLFS